MSYVDFWDRFPVVKGMWLEGVPVYHRREDDIRYLVDGEQQERWSEAVNQWEIRTRCGLRLKWWTRDNTDDDGRMVHLSADNAAAIGRPCRRCWIVEDDE